MGIKQDIMIKSKFGTKTAGRYILRYTSREDATESLDLNEYITKYTTRYSAVEQLKDEAPTPRMIEDQDLKLKRKNGILFGNRGLSYTDEELKHAAKVTQKACEEGHTAILPIVSFSHEYLIDKGIVPADMEKPTKAGLYKGKVDQLKLRMGITKMMDRMHKDMGFNEPEWTGTVQLDTKHVHVHLTTVETGKPLPKRMKTVTKEKKTEVPDMEWIRKPEGNYDQVINKKGFVEYHEDDEIIAVQRESMKGRPKWKTKVTPAGTEKVEAGKIPVKTLQRMRQSLDREISKSKDIKPFVKDIQAARDLTKSLTVNAANYTDATVERIQSLKIALPKDKTLWRADSKSKEMQRPRELADEIVTDLWTKQRDGVALDAFNVAVERYIKAREDEELEEEDKLNIKEEAYSRLRRETVNRLYQSVGNIDDKKLRVEIPKQSIKATSTDVLKDEIADSFHRDVESYDDVIQFEYRNRSYIQRFNESAGNARRYQREITRYDRLKDAGLTMPESKVMRDHYYEEYLYNAAVADKYAYLTTGGAGHVSPERFEEVRGVDLHNMSHDFKPGSDRTVPNHLVSSYNDTAKRRLLKVEGAMKYLVDTDQHDMLPVYRNQRTDRMREIKNAQKIGRQGLLEVPVRKSNDHIEKGMTIDITDGRDMLRDEIQNVRKLTENLAGEYLNEIKVPEKRYAKIDVSKDDINWSDVTKEDSLSDIHVKEERLWAMQRLQYDAYFREQERKAEEERMREEEKEKREKDTSKEKVPDYIEVKPEKDVRKEQVPERRKKRNIFRK